MNFHFFFVFTSSLPSFDAFISEVDSEGAKVVENQPSYFSKVACYLFLAG